MKTSTILYGLSLVAALGNVAALFCPTVEPVDPPARRQEQYPDSLAILPLTTLATVRGRAGVPAPGGGTALNRVLTSIFGTMYDFEQKFQLFINGTSTDSTQLGLVTQALSALSYSLGSASPSLSQVTGHVDQEEFNDMQKAWVGMYWHSKSLNDLFIPQLDELHADLCSNLTDMAHNFQAFNRSVLDTLLRLEAAKEMWTPDWNRWTGDQITFTDCTFQYINTAIDQCNLHVNASSAGNNSTQNATAPAGPSLGPVVDPVFTLLFRFEEKYQPFMKGTKNTHGHAETLALKLKDLVDGLDSAASSVRTFTGNVSSDDLAHLESSYDSASNDTQAYLDDTKFIKQPRFLTKRICDRIQDAGTKFTDLGSAVADKLEAAVKLGTSDDDKDVLKLTVDRIKGRSDAIQGALTHAASKCYDHLSTGESSSVASSTANSTTIVTTTAVPLPPGVVVVSVVNTVTAPCSCGHGLSPRTAAGSSDGPMTTTFFDPNPTTTASITSTDDEALPSTYIMSIFTDTTVSCVCETATRHHHATATETTTKKHLTTVTATATAESEDSGAVANVVGSLGLVAGLFVFLLWFPDV